ncbi:MAG: Cobalt-zinc-cadmium resistance protein CzcB [Planctomycetes bacterium]|nr:Cobalt-zinc-cadmium resistance protein CzcB [Planctomycetota bacterium]
MRAATRHTVRRAAGAAVLSAAVALFLPGCPGGKTGGHAHGEDEHGHGDAGHGEEREGAEAGHADEVTLTAEAIRAAGVRVEVATARILRPTFTVPARAALDTDATAHVGVQFAGRVRDVRVKRGDRVGKGDVLLVFESPEFGREQIEFLAARDALAQAQAPVDLARRLLDRARQAHEASRSLPLSTVEDRERSLLEAETARATAASHVTASENRLHVLGMTQAEVEALAATREVRTLVEVKAPIAGEVIAREVTLGESVGPDRDALVVVAGTESIWVLAEVPESRLADVTTGAKVRVLRGAAGSTPLEGTIAWIEPLVDPGSRTGRVRVVLPRDGSGLVPGMYADVEFTASGPEPVPVVAVPSEAVQTVEGGPAVFVPVKGEENTFAKRSVRVGRPLNGFVPVVEGLAVGEEFVAAGSFVLKADLGKSSAAHEH